MTLATPNVRTRVTRQLLAPIARASASGLYVGIAFATTVAVGVLIAISPSLATTLVVVPAIVAVGVRSASRLSREREASPTPLIPEVMALPLAIGLGVFSSQLSLLLLTGLATSSVFRVANRALGLPVVLLAGCAVPVLAMHGLRIEPLFVLAMIGFVCISNSNRLALLTSFVDGLGLYLGASVAGYFLLGLRSPSAGSRLDSSLDSTTGLFGDRVFFPFAQNLVAPAAVAVAFIAGATPLILANSERRKIRTVGLVAGWFVLLAVDSRAPMAAALVAMLVAGLRPRWLRRGAAPLSVAILLLPFAYPAVQATFQRVIGAAEGTTALVRQREGSTGELNGRATVWKRTIKHVGTLSREQRLLGFGPNGQIASGTSRTYVKLFKGGFANPLAASPHNSVLQQILDGGYLGALLLLTAIYTALRRIQAAAQLDASWLAAPSMMLAMSVVGMTESVLAIAAHPLIVSVLVAVTAAASPLRVPESYSDAESNTEPIREESGVTANTY